MATLAVQAADDVEGKGVVRVDSAGRITAFLEKPPAARARALINSALYMLKSDFVAELPCGMDLASDKTYFRARLNADCASLRTPL